MRRSLLRFVWAGALSHLSTGALAAAGVVTAGFGVRILLEERLLRRAYPDEYAYAERTKRVLPGVV
jgi:protein-S-isoprenylcysteine O-methyltransferase Ste14